MCGFLQKADTEAAYIDAMSIDWKYRFGYAFPPFIMVGAVIKKLMMDRGEIILVVPDWPTKHWYSLLQPLAVDKPLNIPVVQNTLSLCFSPERIHPLVHRMTLQAWHLSMNSGEHKDCRSRLLK